MALIAVGAAPQVTQVVVGSDLATSVAGVAYRWAFVARESAAGVSGELELLMLPGRERVHATVVCASISEATGAARLAARVESSTSPLVPVASFFVWTVVDASTGGAPDLASELVAVGDLEIALGHCAAGLLPLARVLRGHVDIQR